MLITYVVLQVLQDASPIGFSGLCGLVLPPTVHARVDVLCLRLCLALARLLIWLVTDSGGHLVFRLLSVWFS